MQRPSTFLPAPFAMLPGAFAEFSGTARSGQPLPSDVAFQAYCLQPQADTWEDYCMCQANKRVGLMIDTTTGIAVQPVMGRMMQGVSPVYEAYCGWFNTARLVEAARRTATDDAVKALVLYIDSPGGYTPGIREAAIALRSITGKPVLAWLQNAASAAMYVAAGCQQRHAPSFAEIGGIGTFIVTWDASRYYAVQGYEVRLYADGVFKGMGAEGVAWSEDWYSFIEARVAGAGKDFKDFIRASCPAVPDTLMEGQSFPASALRKAKAVGKGHLIDSCPDDSGNDGFPTFADFMATLADAL